MFKKLVPVNKENHASLKVKAINTFDFANNFHIASVMVHEFVRAASVYPVVFLEDKDADEFRPVVMMGLDAGENLFIDDEGKWQASYVPAIIRRYPFALAKTSEDGHYTVCVDEESDFISKDDGEALFDDKGEPTQVIENVKRYLGELQQMEVFTKDFCKFMSENNLFTPLNMRVRASDEIKNITGCYVLNEERLNNMSDKKFLEIKNNHYLAPMYAHLTSLSQIERLAMLKSGEALTKESADKNVH